MPATFRLVLGLIAVAFAVLTACSTGQGGPHVASLASGTAAARTTATGPGDAQHKYYQCLQQQGVKITEPQGTNGNSNAGVQSVDPTVDPNLLRKATEKCRQLLPNGGQPRTADAQQMAVLLKQAQCLRAHGINVPDPTPGQQAQLGTIAIPQGVTPEQFTSALQLCSQAASR